MRAFVTGSTGLLGNNLVRLLIKEGFEVKALARSAAKARELLGDTGAEIVIGDMNNVEAFAQHLEGCDVLFHTAAYFREAFATHDNHWPLLERINITNTIRLFTLAKERGISRIIHTSSNATIRKRADGQPSCEGDGVKVDEALTPYARSKILGDEAIADFSRKHRFPVTTVLPAWMFGPGDAAPTSSGRFVLDYMNRRLQGVFDSGFDVVDARDVVAAMLAACRNGIAGERYIISGSHTSLAELCDGLNRVTGIEAPKRVVPTAMIYTIAWVMERIASLTRRDTNLSVDSVRVLTQKLHTSSSKARKELHMKFRPLEETLRDTVDWLRTYRADAIL